VFLRVDLRQDLAHLVVIKTWPVPGAAIVRGEVLAPAIALSAAAAAGILVGALFAPDKMILSGGDVAGRVGFFVAATVAACAAVVAQLVIQNGIAAMYPAWIRITPGATQPGGIEMMGQILVVMYGGLLALLLAALPPAVGAAAIRFATGEWLAPAAVFAVLLSIESYAATELIGRVLDRTDLQDVALAD
jgi:hypothetical protein